MQLCGNFYIMPSLAEQNKVVCERFYETETFLIIKHLTKRDWFAFVSPAFDQNRNLNNTV